MAITFKEFLLESISIVNDKIQISKQSYRAGSTKDEISTYFKNQPYVTSIKGVDAEVYSILNYISSEVSTDILKSLKGSGPYKVDDRQFSHFMEQVKAAAAGIVRKVKPDIIIYPKSRSPLVKQFVDEIAKNYPSAEVLTDSFIKSVLNAEDIEPLINTKHPDWEKFAESNPKAVKQLKQQLKNLISGGELELKKFYKPYTKFIKNFIEIKDAYEVLDKVMGRNVLVVDDILSSGSTMGEMIRQLSDFEPNEITGLTLFKYTSASK